MQSLIKFLNCNPALCAKNCRTNLLFKYSSFHIAWNFKLILKSMWKIYIRDLTSHVILLDRSLDHNCISIGHWSFEETIHHFWDGHMIPLFDRIIRVEFLNFIKYLTCLSLIVISRSAKIVWSNSMFQNSARHRPNADWHRHEAVSES